MEDMRELDVKRFWEDYAQTCKGNCFNPEVALGAISNECVFIELDADKDRRPWDACEAEAMRGYIRMLQ
ncbi:MAG: hypothetical protein LBU32_14705 [Clostridiales bacterium]|nr:hypothetical protein [Clostridiales bacterium]